MSETLKSRAPKILSLQYLPCAHAIGGGRVVAGVRI
jgi:hypothetical protein